jgi:hypothetical protein
VTPVFLERIVALDQTRHLNPFAAPLRINKLINLTPVILANIVALDRPDASLAPIFGVGFQKRKIL